jgi:ankyrin repeat protein
MRGQNDFAEMLIENNADVNAVDNLEHSAAYYAAENGYTEITEQLIAAGAVN